MASNFNSFDDDKGADLRFNIDNLKNFSSIGWVKKLLSLDPKVLGAPMTKEGFIKLLNSTIRDE